MSKLARASKKPISRREFLAGMGGAAAGMGLSEGPPVEPAYAAIVPSPIACGQLRSLDVAAAQKLPDVLLIVRIGDDTIDYLGQPLALCVATRKEAAEAGARRCAPHFESRPAVLTTAAALPSAYAPSPDEQRGDPDSAMIESQLQGGAHVAVLRQTYRTAPEPFEKFGEAPGRDALVALAERAVKRKVVLVDSPAQKAALAQAIGGQRPETIQTLTLCAARDGRLRTLIVNAMNDTALRAEYVEPVEVVARHLYHADNLRIAHKLVRKNIAPRSDGGQLFAGVSSGLFALESALDELAHLLRVDPLWLRRINYAEIDEASTKPWAAKRLRECYRVGEEQSGWIDRKREPRENREPNGPFIGLGMAGTMSPPRPLNGEMTALFGAHFSRVTVDTPSGEIRVTRHLTVLDVGTNATPGLLAAARSGVSQALAAMFIEGTKGFVPAAIEVTLLESENNSAAPPSWQAVRELSAAGVAAAVANAVHNACGMRYRELPIRPLQVVG